MIDVLKPATRIWRLAAGMISIVAMCLALTGCAPRPTELTLMTHDSWAISDDVMATFETRHGVDVQVLKAGDAGAMVNQAILTKDNPLADVLYGVDNTFLSRAIDAGILQAYRSTEIERVPEALRVGTQDLATPIDYGDVCLNYDLEVFVSGTPLLENLTDPGYRGLLVVENPATSSPGLAFLLATVARFGETGEYTWREYWAELVENDVLVVDSWESAYNGSFSGGAGEGDRPIVVSYATSPAAEVVFTDPPPDEPSTAVMTDGCFRQVEYAAVLVGTDTPALAQAFIDFMLEPGFQEDIPLNMFVFPAAQDATLPPVFVEHAAQVTDPISPDPALIATERDRWIQEWTDVVLR